MKYLVLLGLLPSIVFAELPIWSIGDLHWIGTKPIWLSQCEQTTFDDNRFVVKQKFSVADMLSVEAPHRESFKEFKEYPSFQKQYGQRPTQLFVLSKMGSDEVGVLERLDPITQEVLSRYVLPWPIEQGTLSSTDVYFQKAWHTVLFVTAKASQQARSYLWIFDITNPPSRLSPFYLYQKGALTRPSVLRFSDGQFGLLVSGVTQGAVLRLDQKTLPQVFSIEGGRFDLLRSIVNNSTGVVDSVLAVNSKGLWIAQLTDQHTVRFELTVAGRVHGIPIISAHPRESGLRIYFLAENSRGRGLFVWEEYTKKVRWLLKGNYAKVLPAFDKLVLVPSTVGEEAVVLDKRNHQRIQQNLVLGKAGKTVYDAVLQWEKASQSEKLLVLNASCQLSMTVLHLNNQQRRLSLRSVE